MPKSCSRADIFGFILDLRMVLRVFVAWSKSLYQSYNDKLDWHWKILRWNDYWMFVLIVNIHYEGACLVAPTESQHYYLEEFEWGCWKLHCKVFVSVVSDIWLIGCCIMININWQLIIPQFFSLLLLGCHCCHIHAPPWCIYYLRNTLMGIYLWVMNLSLL